MTDERAGPGPGPVALVGSGEFLPGMSEVDDLLLRGRPRHVAVIPTAAGTEGDRSVRRWLDLAGRHYADLDATVLEVDVRDQASAAAWTDELADVGLVYLSGGKPAHLVASLRGTPLLDGILAAWRGGAALVGCSAGAMALAEVLVAAPWRAAQEWTPGFGVVPGIGVLPHFDRYVRGPGKAAARFAVRPPDGIDVVGIDEDTALVQQGDTWEVHGVGSAWQVTRDAITPLDPSTISTPIS